LQLQRTWRPGGVENPINLKLSDPLGVGALFCAPIATNSCYQWLMLAGANEAIKPWDPRLRVGWPVRFASSPRANVNEPRSIGKFIRWLVTLHAKANFGCMRSNFHKFYSRRGARVQKISETNELTNKLANERNDVHSFHLQINLNPQVSDKRENGILE
jgi:hypothetical protein